MKQLTVALLTILLLPAICGAATPPTMPFDDVKTGMVGTGRTVFAGTEVVDFKIEIIGKLPNIAPDQNLILARCSGGPLAETGVLSGMSGSPVTIDGKLIGAVAYSWGFSTEAIAGITPIEEMLRVAQLDGLEANRNARRQRRLPETLLRPNSTPALESFSASLLEVLSPQLSTPFQSRPELSVSGFPLAGVERLRRRLPDASWSATTSSGTDPGATPAPLEPGSPVGLQLIRGDVDFSATGTISWIDGDRLLAFGHPLFGLGSVDLPMTAARVETLLPNLQQSSRIAIPTSPIGALRQDRNAAVFGRLGAEPSMIPVRVQLRSGESERRYSFEIADDAMLAPVLLHFATTGLVGGSERISGDTSIRIAAGSLIKLSDGQDVLLDNHFSGSSAFNMATITPAFMLHLLMNESWDAAPIAGINLLFDYEPRALTQRIERVVADRYLVAPAETVDLTIDLRSSQNERRSISASITLPDSLTDGPLTLLIAGAAMVQREDPGDVPLLPRDSDRLIRLINRLRRNDQIFIVAKRDEPSLYVDGQQLSSLPPSAGWILKRPAGRAGRFELSQRRILEETVSAGAFVEGFARIELQVRR